MDFIVNGIALPDKYFHSSKDINTAIVLVEDELDEKIDEVIRTLIEDHIDKFIEHGSDVVFVRSNWLDVKTARYNTMGSGYIKTPKALDASKAILNIQNDDHMCALYSALAALHPVSRKDHPYRVSIIKDIKMIQEPNLM